MIQEYLISGLIDIKTANAYKQMQLTGPCTSSFFFFLKIIYFYYTFSISIYPSDPLFDCLPATRLLPCSHRTVVRVYEFFFLIIDFVLYSLTGHLRSYIFLRKKCLVTKLQTHFSKFSEMYLLNLLSFSEYICVDYVKGKMC